MKRYSVAIGTFFVILGIISRYSDIASSVTLSLYVLGIVIAGREMLLAGLRAILKLKLDMNSLMLCAATGGLIIGEWTEAAVIVILFAISALLESYSLDKSRQAVQKLIESAPQTAIVIKNELQVELPVLEVMIDDTVLVKPGATVPVDGEILSGVSSVNNVAITGESVPLPVKAGIMLPSGSINGEGSLLIKAIRKPGDNTLDRIIKLVKKAEEDKPDIHTFIERFAKVYTPVVFGIAILTAVIPPLLFNQVWSEWIYRALAMLIIGCPCALILSTPATVVSALANAAQNGVLIKGGAYFEVLHNMPAFAFDKTGTVTKGELTVSDIFPINGNSASELLSLAATVEAHSEHHIGRAIHEHALQSEVEVGTPVNFSVYPGKGASANVDDEEIFVGKHDLFEELDICDSSIHSLLEQVESSNQIPVIVGSRRNVNGLISVSDTPRPEAAGTLAALRTSGVKQIALLTGDHRRIGESVGEQIGCNKVYAELLPAEKVEALKKMRAEFGKVAMVGDGINDAPSLAVADVGIAMGKSAADATLETADVVLMGDKIEKLSWLMRLSQKTHHLIVMNIAVALGVKIAFLGLAVSGLATLWMAVFADTGITILVVFNGMRALRSM